MTSASRGDTAHVLLAEWSETRCFPPLDDDAIARLAASAGRNRDNAIGSRHPSASEFEPATIDETKGASQADRDHSPQAAPSCPSPLVNSTGERPSRFKS